MYALFKETSHQNFLSHKSNYGKNPAANPKNWVAFDGQHIHYSTNNLEALTDTLIWYFRKTAGELNESIFNDRAIITAIKGNSVIYNNYAGEKIFQQGYWVGSNTLTISDGELHFTNNSSNGYMYTRSYTAYPNHKYLLYALMKCSSSSNPVYLRLDNGSYSAHTTKVNEWEIVQTIETTPATIDTHTLNIRWSGSGGGGETADIKYINVIDLTLMYGLGKEPTIAQFKIDYFNLFGHTMDYDNEFNIGNIRNTKITGIQTIGFNQWDEVWQLNGRTYDYNATLQYDAKLANINLIPIIPNEKYYFKTPVPVNIWFYNYKGQCIFYDSNSGGWGTFTADENWHYLSFSTFGSSQTTYNNNVCLNLFDSKFNSLYESYENRNYSIPITSITGKLNGTGNSVVVFTDGMNSLGDIADEIYIEGGITKAIKRVGSVDLSTCSVAQLNVNSLHCGGITVPNIAACAGQYTSRLKHSKYPIANIDGGMTGIGQSNYDLIIGYRGHDNNATDKQIVFKDTSATNASTLLNKLQNTTLLYALETPEIYVLDNFTLPLNIKVWKTGSERILCDDLTSTAPTFTTHYNT